MKTIDVPFMAINHLFLENTAYLLNFARTFLFFPDENIYSVYMCAFF